MVYLISTATENALLFCDASKPFCEFVFWCVFLVKHTPFHLIKISHSAPCSRPCTSPKSAFSGTSSCTRTAHTERWAPDASSATPHLNRSGRLHAPRAAHQGENKGGHLKRKLYFHGK